MKNHYPIDKYGNMLDYEYPYHVAGWEPFTQFKASLRFITTERGRSSFRLICKDVFTGKQYSVMYKSCDEFIKRAKNGVVEGEWKTIKHGGSFGVVLLDEESVDE